MPLKKCRDCGLDVSADAGKCPHCGKPQTKSTWGCLIIFIFLFILSASYSFSEDIPCVAGRCEGWFIESLGRTPNSETVFRFENNSGIAAFDLTVIINFYDYFGKYIRKFTWKHPGPIHQFWNVDVRCPDEMFKWTGEIYYKTEYSK